MLAEIADAAKADMYSEGEAKSDKTEAFFRELGGLSKTVGVEATKVAHDPAHITRHFEKGFKEDHDSTVIAALNDAMANCKTPADRAKLVRGLESVMMADPAGAARA